MKFTVGGDIGSDANASLVVKAIGAGAIFVFDFSRVEEKMLSSLPIVREGNASMETFVPRVHLIPSIPLGEGLAHALAIKYAQVHLRIKTVSYTHLTLPTTVIV